MGYQVKTVSGGAGENRKLAEFLAAFVADGELLLPKDGDDDPDVWQRRMGWWWDQNPYCETDSPRGFILHDENGTIVGFNGLIPFEYQCNSEIIPSLVTTTFFVREEHRSAVMGMITKQRRLARDFQIIDGSPSPEMRTLLEKLGYAKCQERYQYFFPTTRTGGKPSRSLLTSLGYSFPLPETPLDESEYIAKHPEEIESIPRVENGRISRHITTESLSWLSSVGSEERQFFGLCDRFGELQSYAIGIYKKKFGVRACMLMDYQDLTDDKSGIPRLISRILSQPKQSGLDSTTSLLTWTRLALEPTIEEPGLRRDSILHFHLPKRWEETPKSCVPFEGDLPLL